MGKKTIAILSLVIILAFMGYMIYDAFRGANTVSTTALKPDQEQVADWDIERIWMVHAGPLTSVAVGQDGKVFLGGASYVSALNHDLGGLWSVETEASITALAVSGDTVFAASNEIIYLISRNA